ncbi:MAG: CehA/McbA family metallohydrolase [Ignavibacteriales bacterium]|nr:CehA/McbA family metallohydrolase [Ignavibacteriales bacterium]
MLFLYAETHYRFRFFLSFLKKKEPELIADAPFRVEPGQSIPLLLLAKDSDRYPIWLRKVLITVSQGSKEIRRLEVLRKSLRLSAKWWWKVVSIPAKELEGWIEIDVQFELQNDKEIRTYHNDNYRTSSRSPLRVYVASHPLPRLGGVHYGDIHTHSDYTEDQVEFGVPLDAAVRLSGALGLSFFAVTDHSYDLDDAIDNYLKNDAARPKWKRLGANIDKLALRHRDFAVIRGEEVSCRSASGHNLHLLRLGSREFIPGSGDGAERWFRTRSEHSASELLGMASMGAVFFAAHPAENVPILQRVLLHRGSWLDRDIRLPGLTGVQFANGSASGFPRGLRQWTSALLRGHRLIAVAGNDAHGNFNRFRQLGIPFFSIRETQEHLFGRMRTGVFSASVRESSILRSLSAGRCIVTDGPVAQLVGRTAAGGRIPMGSHPFTDQLGIEVQAKSSPEFGRINRIVVFAGTLGENHETVLWQSQGGDFDFFKRLRCKFRGPSYVRLEVGTSSENAFDSRPHFCLTNPIWVG